MSLGGARPTEHWLIGQYQTILVDRDIFGGVNRQDTLLGLGFACIDCADARVRAPSEENFGVQLIRPIDITRK